MPKKPQVDPKVSEVKRKAGQLGGLATRKRRGRNYYAKIAKLSHPRKSYNGGRPKKTDASTLGKKD